MLRFGAYAVVFQNDCGIVPHLSRCRDFELMHWQHWDCPAEKGSFQATFLGKPSGKQSIPSEHWGMRGGKIDPSSLYQLGLSLAR
jgi:hypothetical protein